MPAFASAQRLFIAAAIFIFVAADIVRFFFTGVSALAFAGALEAAAGFFLLTFAQRACWDAFIFAMVAAERLPFLPSLFAEVDLVVAGAGVDPLNSAVISASSAAICSAMETACWSWASVGVDICERPSGKRRERQCSAELFGCSTKLVTGERQGSLVGSPKITVKQSPFKLPTMAKHKPRRTQERVR